MPKNKCWVTTGICLAVAAAMLLVISQLSDTTPSPPTTDTAVTTYEDIASVFSPAPRIRDKKVAAPTPGLTVADRAEVADRGSDDPDLISEDSVRTAQVEAKPARIPVFKTVQSKARPFGLDVISPVQEAATDEASSDFKENILPPLLGFIQSNLLHTTSIKSNSTEASLSNLTLPLTAETRVYFVTEGADYHNSIGLNLQESIDGDIDSKLIFPDASVPGILSSSRRKPRNTPSPRSPMTPGDFVDIGSAEGGTPLDFFIIPRGGESRGANEAYGVEKEFNRDKTSHAQILGTVGDSMLLVGFEDMYRGGDNDYDDVIIAVDIGVENMESMANSLGLSDYRDMGEIRVPTVYVP